MISLQRNQTQEGFEKVHRAFVAIGSRGKRSLIVTEMSNARMSAPSKLVIWTSKASFEAIFDFIRYTRSMTFMSEVRCSHRLDVRSDLVVIPQGFGLKF